LKALVKEPAAVLAEGREIAIVDRVVAWETAQE